MLCQDAVPAILALLLLSGLPVALSKLGLGYKSNLNQEAKQPDCMLDCDYCSYFFF